MDGNKEKEEYIDLSSPKWDQSTYIGRAKHFFAATNPLNVFATSAELQTAKDVVEQHKKVVSMRWRNGLLVKNNILKKFECT